MSRQGFHRCWNRRPKGLGGFNDLRLRRSVRGSSTTPSVTPRNLSQGAAAMLNRSAKTSFQSPSQVIESIPQRHRPHPKVSGPIQEALCLAVERDIDVAAPVPRLLSVRRPMAVRRFVISVVVDPVNWVFRSGASTYINEECFRVAPSLTNRNSSSAVAKIGLALGVFAAINHTSPDAILCTFGQPVGCHRACSAASRSLCAEMVSGNLANCATVALACPVNLVMSLCRGTR